MKKRYFIIGIILVILSLACFIFISYSNNEKIIPDSINIKYISNNDNTITVVVTSDIGFLETKPTWVLSEDKKSYSKVFDYNITYSTPFQKIDGQIYDTEIIVNQILKIDYLKNDNCTITVKVTSSVGFLETKPSWQLSNDKKSYYKTFDYNITYITNFEEINGNIYDKEIKINQLPDVKYIKNIDGSITAKITSAIGFLDTKPSWQLSVDKKSYSKTFFENITYETPFQEIDGSVYNGRIVIDEIVKGEPQVEYIKNIDGSITAKVTSTIGFIETKPSWQLSADRKSYTKVFDSNIIYTTPFQEIDGNIVELEIKIDQIVKGEVNIEYIKNMDGTIMAKVTSSVGFLETKPSWQLSADRKSYTKVFDSNIIYTTPFQDIYGNIFDLEVRICNIQKFEPKVEYIENSDGTMTVKVNSDVEFENTKPSWQLSADKKSYTKIFTSNIKYATPFQDIYGNIVDVEININKLIEIEYIQHNDNTVTVVMHSKIGFKDTKPTWQLSGDKLSYSKVFFGNIEYTTPVEEISGKETIISLNINQVIEMQYIKNNDNTVTIKLYSNIGFADTKPTWQLSNDRKIYSKIFDDNINYSTSVQDLNGNIVDISIVIENISNFNKLDTSTYVGYKSLLSKVQANHPNWTIRIEYVGLNWDDAINAEYGFSGGSPRSLINEYYTGEWRDATDKNRYDVSKQWFRASKKAIAYMMDPRNSLDEKWIFQFLDISAPTGTYDEIAKMVRGTFLDKDSYIRAIIEGAQKYKVSPFHMVSRILEEQGNDGKGIMNGYEISKDVYVYNLYNIQVCGDTAAGIQQGAKYALNKQWFTAEASIIGGAEFLREGYLNAGQTTLYYQKYNVVNKRNLYNNQYMQNIRAANDEGNIMYNAYKKNNLLDSHFTFVIPVFEKMPSATCASPVR